MFRLGLKRILPVQTSLNRFIRNYRLTQNEISAGLKPLVIKIHPDLFANYPDIQVRTLQTTVTVGSCLDGLTLKVSVLVKKSLEKM